MSDPTRVLIPLVGHFWIMVSQNFRYLLTHVLQAPAFYGFRFTFYSDDRLKIMIERGQHVMG